MKRFYYLIVIIALLSMTSKAQETPQMVPTVTMENTSSINEEDIIYSSQSGNSMPTQLSQTNEQEISAINNKGLWPSKGTIGFEMNFLFDVTNQKLLGKEINDFINSENLFLTNLDLVLVKTDPTGQVVSTTPVNNYEYGTPMFVDFRVLYYFSDCIGLGVRISFQQYEQKLPEGNGLGYLYNLNYSGACFNYIPYHNDRIGVAVKADIGFPSGYFETVPALHSHYDTPDGTSLYHIINIVHKSVNISGVQVNIGTTVDFLGTSWMGFNAGLHVYYLNASLTSPLWTSSQKSFNTITSAVSVGVNFYLWNN